MADPRILGPQQRKANLSPLMLAKQGAVSGEKVNFCPYGCTDEEIDENGYCRHLIGFTTDGKNMEPMRYNERGLRQVIVKYVPRDGQPGKDAKAVPVLEPVLKTDQLVQITVSSRVYRDVDKFKDTTPSQNLQVDVTAPVQKK